MAIPMIPGRAPVGIQAGSPDLIGLQRRVQALDSSTNPKQDQLANYLIQLTQQNKVGTPEYFIAAGEYQNRQKMRQEQQAKQPDQPKVMQKLIASAAQETAMNRGIPALPAQNVGGYAPGGIVAFEDGGAVPRYQGQSGSVVRTPTQPTFITAMRDPSQMDLATLRAYYLSRGEPLPVELMTEEERRRGPYPAGVFPKIGRVFSDIGESAGNVVFPGGVNFYNASARAATPATLAARGEPGATGDPTIMTPGDLKRFEKAQGSAYMNQPAETAPYIPRGMQMGDVSKAPAAAPFGAFMAQAEKELGAKGAGPMTAAERVQQMKDYMKAAGYDDSFFEKQRGEIEKEKGKTDEDKRQATNMRLIEMGLGILGGESPYAFVNIGKGAAPALKGLQEDLKDIRKLNREYDKAIRDLNVAEQSGKREMGLKALQRAQEKEDQMEQKKFDLAKTMMTIQANKDIAGMPGVQERLISRMGDPAFAALAERYAKTLGPSAGSGARVDAAIIQDYAKNPWKLEALKDSDPNLYNYIKAQLAGMSVPSVISTPTGKVRE
jgi:hypothetical protein